MADQRNEEAESRVDLDHAIVFTTLTDDQIQTQVKRLILTEKDGITACAISFEVEWQTYQQILLGEWFGLHPAARGGFSEVAFEEGRTVELRAILRQSLVKAAKLHEAGVEDVVHALLQEDSREARLLKMSEGWLAAEVKQQVDLPDELDGGTLKKGYRTIWAQPANSKLAAAQPRAALNEIVESFFDSAEWTYERMDESILRLQFRGEQGEWVVLVRTDEEKQLCIVYSIYPDFVPEAYRPTMAAWLTQENYNLPIGNFEMDAADGELRFRTGIDVEHDRLTAELFGQLFTTNIAVMDQYFDAIAKAQFP